MRQTVLVVAVLVVVGFAAPAVVASPAAAPTDAAGSLAVQDADGNETANETAPGARLAGVVNVQGAEVEGAVAERSFGVQLAAAASNASKAAVLANQTGDLEERVEELRERKQALETAYDNGSISEGRYRAEMARVATELSTANRLLERTSRAVRELPPEALESAGVDVTALEQLREAAGELSGPEIAEIARDIAGPPLNVSVGPPENVTRGPPGENDTRGPPGDGDLPPGLDADDLPEDVSLEDLPENVTDDQLANLTDGDLKNDSVGDVLDDDFDEDSDDDSGDSDDDSDNSDDNDDATTESAANS